MTYREAFEAFKREYWRRILAETGGNISAAARLAGRNRTDTHKCVKQAGIYTPRQNRGNWGSLR
jgi:two-component system response regulator GlrR